MKLTNYKTNNLPSDIRQMSTSAPSLNQYLRNDKNLKRELLSAIVVISSKYLKMIENNIINDEDKLFLLAETILSEFGNLELQEIEYVFKKGITGKFGTIYKTVDIATITGIGDNCWFENYYKNHRPKRETKNEVEISKNAISYEEYIEKNPDQRDLLFLFDIRIRVKNQTITIDEILKVLEIKGIDSKSWYNETKKQYNVKMKVNEIDYIKIEGNKLVKKIINE